MKKLLTLIGANVLIITTVTPMIVNLNPNMTTNTKYFANEQKQMPAEITISNSKHKDANGKLILGTKDYKDEFSKSINSIRTTLKKENATNITVSNIKIKFLKLDEWGIIAIPGEYFSDLLAAKNVEITSLEVTIGNAGPYLNTYQILYSAIIDGKKVNRVNINGYSWRKMFLSTVVGSPYIIKFNINYNSEKQEKTNLQNAFKDFQFTDDKGVKNFLDTNNLTNITKQIKKHLGINDLNDAKLSLENLTSNSVTLVAARDSEKYQGQITLTWNLKLFEIYGSHLGSSNKWVEKGLKGYFYLEKQTKQIKFFSLIEYFYPGHMVEIHPSFKDYHKFNFKNQNNEEKNFTFDGKELSYKVIKRFGTFNLTDETKVKIESPELWNVKLFNTINNTWERVLYQKTEFIINSLGQITKVQNNLKEIFQDFQFTDDKGVKGYADTNNLTNITEQIKKHLGLNNLKDEKISLQNLTSNSVTLVGPNKGKYQGEVTLTWNLKLFEIYGIGLPTSSDKWIKEGLKGYFYLDTTKQIKFFSYLMYIRSGNQIQIHPNFDDYHKFTFKNEKNDEKVFTFNGKEWCGDVVKRFFHFELTEETKVKIESPELNRVKVFDSSNNEWKGLTQKSEFIINKLGQITKISN